MPREKLDHIVAGALATAIAAMGVPFMVAAYVTFTSSGTGGRCSIP